MKPTDMEPDTRTAMESLDAVETFALGGVGFAGTPNPGETTALRLAQLPDATEAFAWLAANGSPAARLYGYWALRTLAPERANAVANVLENDHEMVETMSGCIVSQDSVGSIVAGMRDPTRGVGHAMPRP